MDHFAGLDVSVKDTSVCIVDDTGKIVREVKVASEPTALLAVLKNPGYHFKRIGLEAGPLMALLQGAPVSIAPQETRSMNCFAPVGGTFGLGRSAGRIDLSAAGRAGLRMKWGRRVLGG